MELRNQDLQAANLNSVAVGIGEPKHAIRVCGKFAPSQRCLSDATVASHQSYGIQRGGIVQLMNPQVVAAGFRAASQGITPEAPTGDAAMMPATFLIDRHGVIQWFHYGKHAADHPNMDEILAVAKNLSA